MESDQATQLRQQVNAAIEQLAANLEAGYSEQLQTFLTFASRLPKYSLSNTALIWQQRPDASHVAGLRTWRQLGRRVRRGETGIRILAPVRRKVEREQPVGEAEDDTNAADETRAGGKAEEIVAFRPVSVFDVAQTMGRPLPEPAQAQGEPGDAVERLEAFARCRGITVETTNQMGRADGTSSGGWIRVRAGLSRAERLSVLAHELAHELRHHTGADTDAHIQETEAEAVAFVICQRVGVDARVAAADYVQTWGGDTDTLRRSLQRIHKTAGELLRAVDRV